MPRPAVATFDAALSEKVARLDLDAEGSGGSSEGGESNAATSAAAVTPSPSSGPLRLAGGVLPHGEVPSAGCDAGSSAAAGEEGIEEPLRRNGAAEAAAASAAATAETAAIMGEREGVERDRGRGDGGEERANASSSFDARPPLPPPDTQPANCSFFLKTATCAFGSKCRFAHPVDQAPPVRFNVLGLPLRPAEPPCA